MVWWVHQWGTSLVTYFCEALAILTIDFVTLLLLPLLLAKGGEGVTAEVDRIIITNLYRQKRPVLGQDVPRENSLQPVSGSGTVGASRMGQVARG